MTRDERYFRAWIERIGREPASWFALPSENVLWSDIILGIWDHYPEPGLHTAIFYGLSEAGHEESAELSLTLDTDPTLAATALANLLNWKRGENPFAIGSLFDYGQALGERSAMSAFLVFQFLLEGGESAARLSLGDGEEVLVRSVIPLHRGEVDLLHKVGMRKFLALPEFRLFSVSRPDLSVLYRVG